MKAINKRAVVINLLGLIMSRAILYSMNPIAIAFFSAAYTEKSMRFLLLLTTIGGITLWMPMLEAIRYITIILIVVVAVGLIERQGKRLSSLAMGGLTTVITIGVSVAFWIQKGYQLDRLYLIGIEALLVFTVYNVFVIGLHYFYRCKKGQAPNNEELISASILFALLVYATPVVGSLDFSFKETLAYLLILFMGYKFGAGAGAICGTASGIVLGLQNSNLNLIGIMCLLGISTGIFRKVGRFGSGISFVVITVTFGYMYEPSLLEVSAVRALASSVAAFMILPRKILYSVEGMTEPVREAEEKDRIQELAKGKLNEFAESFRKLSKTFYEISETKASLSREDINYIFDGLSDNLCKNCINCNECWKNNFYDTYRAAFSILSSAERNGAVDREDIPVGFARQCVNLDAFLYETNRSLELAKINLGWHNRMAESREAIAGQLGEVASIIQDFSMDLYDSVGLNQEVKESIIVFFRSKHIDVKSVNVIEKRNKKQEFYLIARTKNGRCVTMREAASYLGEVIGKRMKPAEGAKNIISKEFDTICFIEDTNFKTLTGVARAIKSSEKVSGDNFSFIHLSNGEMIMTLSDGMGTGEQACEESESVIELLEQFMEAGFREESAIKLINSILVLKSDQQSCSTIDMSIINLFTGVCDFIKIGAAATFIKRDEWVEVITSTSLPVGVFNQVDIDGVSKKLYDGDIVIMITDGVLDCIQDIEKEKFISDVLADIKSRNPQEIANEVLDRAIEQNNHTAVDDMTVIVAGVWKK